MKVVASVPATLALFLAAAFAEIGGGYLMWQWLRGPRGVAVGVLGALVLVGYGVLPTLQPAHFSRVYAAYGGLFVVMSLLWGWALEGDAPDRWDLVGMALCLAGAAVIFYAPRR